MEAHWEFYLQYENMIRYFARRIGPTQVDELMSEAALRLPRIFELYDGIRPLKTYVISQLKWYFYKYVTRSSHRPTVDLPEDIGYCEKSDSSLEVQLLLKGIPNEDAKLLILRHCYELTYDEIADVLGFGSYGTARRACMAALERTKRDLSKAP